MRATKRTYFLCKSETFLLEPYLFPSSPGTILKLCAQCPRRRGTKGPSCSGINRPDQIPRGHAAPIHASKSWKPEDPGFHRDRERWKPFDESRLRIYGGTLLKRPSSPPPLFLSSFYPLGLEIGLSRFTVPFGETAAEDSRSDICWPPLRECVEQWQPPSSSIAILFFLSSVTQWRRKLGPLKRREWRRFSRLVCRTSTLSILSGGDRLMDGCLQFRSLFTARHITF